MNQHAESEDAPERPAAATPSSELNREPLEPASAETAAAYIEAAYRLVPPESGALLADPNVVLTLAGARGFTEFKAEDVQPGSVEAWSGLGAKLGGDLRFTPHESTNSIDGVTSLLVDVESLDGYVRVSRATKLPGIPVYDSSTGWDGVDDWRQEALAGVRAAAAGGRYPAGILKDRNDEHLLAGVARGYPDAAVLAAMRRDTRPAGEEPPKLAHTAIAAADHYPNAQPNYIYDPNDEAVVAPHVEAWGQILTDYYASPAHERLAADPKFQAARAEIIAQAENRWRGAGRSEIRELLNESRALETEAQELLARAGELATKTGDPQIIRRTDGRDFSWLAALEPKPNDPALTQLIEIAAKILDLEKAHKVVQDKRDVLRRGAHRTRDEALQASRPPATTPPPETDQPSQLVVE